MVTDQAEVFDHRIFPEGVQEEAQRKEIPGTRTKFERAKTPEKTGVPSHRSYEGNFSE